MLVIFLAIALHGALASATSRGGPSAAAYAELPKLKRYRDGLDASLSRLEREGTPLVFVDGKVPSYVDPLGGPTARHSVALRAMGKKAEFKKRGPGVLEIASGGSIGPSVRRR
ncbi:MAG: hypothetical protein FJ104_17765 [Deltaproteobacteria bacterium]|nr:hypothetical protein [Deltaproteobacteria bacterium]